MNRYYTNQNCFKSCLLNFNFATIIGNWYSAIAAFHKCDFTQAFDGFAYQIYRACCPAIGSPLARMIASPLPFQNVLSKTEVEGIFSNSRLVRFTVFSSAEERNMHHIKYVLIEWW